MCFHEHWFCYGDCKPSASGKEPDHVVLESSKVCASWSRGRPACPRLDLAGNWLFPTFQQRGNEIRRMVSVSHCAVLISQVTCSTVDFATTCCKNGLDSAVVSAQLRPGSWPWHILRWGTRGTHLAHKVDRDLESWCPWGNLEKDSLRKLRASCSS